MRLADRLLHRDAGEVQIFGIDLILSRDTLALFAQDADKSLRHDGLNRRGDEERLDAHVNQTRNRARSVVGVQRREDQVSCQRRLNRDFGDFLITDFTDQNDVRRLTKHRPEDLRESQSDVLANLALIDSFELIFDGIFSGDDLLVGAVEDVERRVQRCRLA